MKVQPKTGVGLVVFAVYLVVFYGIWIINGIEYDHIGDDASTLLKWYVAPLAGGAVVLVIAATVLGWWGPALREAKRAPTWALVTPLIMLVAAVVTLVSKDYSKTTGTMMLYLVLGSLGVGFCEETAARGLLLTGLRGSMGEPAAWFFSCLLFGLLHLPNWVFGAGPAAAFQVVLAFGGGSTLYLARRGFGSLVPAMAIHGLWDFAGFAGDGGAALASLLSLPLGAVSVVVCLVLLRARRDDDLAPYAAKHAAVA